MTIWLWGAQSGRLFDKDERNQLMKRQPLNMVFAPARLAPRTCSPSDRAGFVFSTSNADTGCRNRLFDPPKIVAVGRLDRQRQMAKPSTSAKLSVWSARKMLYNLKASWYL